MNMFAKLISSLNPYDPSKLKESEFKPIVVDESNIRKRTLQTMLILFGAFFAWSVLAPLDAGVHITGKVAVSGKKKEVAHPNGGVVQELLVEEGDRVEKGQVLLKVNPLTTEARLNDAQLEYVNMLAMESRLVSEQQGLNEIVWLDGLKEMSTNDPRITQVMASQERVFESGRSERIQEKSIINQKLSSYRAQLVELQGVLDLKKAQLATLSEEAKSSRDLANEGFVPKSAANEVDRQRSTLLASISTTVNEISTVQSSIAQGRLELVQIDAKFQKEINERLTEVQKQRKSLNTQVESLRFDRDLAEVKAPASGIVVGLKVNTVGGVIRGADVLMEIVPDDGNLVVEARVPPVFIDKVRNGMETDMRFSAFNRNTTPVIDGKVSLVGADLLPADKDQDEYYLALIETTTDGLKALGDLEVQPGMPVEVIVKNGERTFISYLLKPLTDRFAIAFKD
jgi:protease secretion system membrane fusion protein